MWLRPRTLLHNEMERNKNAIKVFVYVQLDVFGKFSARANGLHNLHLTSLLHPTKLKMHPTFMAVHPTHKILSKWPTFSK